MSLNITRAVLVTAALTTVLTLPACSRQETWCEEDISDERVDRNLCANGVAGYEWEPDSDKGVKKYTTKASIPKTTPSRPPGTWPTPTTVKPPAVKPTVAKPPPSKPAAHKPSPAHR